MTAELLGWAVRRPPLLALILLVRICLDYSVALTASGKALALIRKPA